MNFSLANMNATAGYLDYNTTDFFDKNDIIPNYSEIIISSVIFIISYIGVTLNGIVIWLLGFQIKRTPFTMLILNLAIVDFGFLVLSPIFCTYYIKEPVESTISSFIIYCLFYTLYINGLFLLTAISIDRCVAVLFPIWHRCSRPKYLSSAVCVFLWICSFLLVGIPNIMKNVFYFHGFSNLDFVVPSVLCVPLITISTLILFIKICLKPKQIKRGQLLLMTLIALLFFLILTLPLHIYAFIIKCFESVNLVQFPGLGNYLFLGASLNSSINPVIYYLVGRKKRAQTMESIKVVFQRVFREDEAPESTAISTNRVSTLL